MMFLLENDLFINKIIFSRSVNGFIRKRLGSPKTKTVDNLCFNSQFPANNNIEN